MDEASLLMEEAMELEDLEVEIIPSAVNKKPSTSTSFSLPLITLNEESQEESQKESDEDEDDKVVEVVIPIKNNNKQSDHWEWLAFQNVFAFSIF